MWLKLRMVLRTNRKRNEKKWRAQTDVKKKIRLFDCSSNLYSAMWRLKKTMLSSTFFDRKKKKNSFF